MTYRQRIQQQTEKRAFDALSAQIETTQFNVLQGLDDFHCYVKGFEIGFGESSTGQENPMSECSIADQSPYPTSFRKGYYAGFEAGQAASR